VFIPFHIEKDFAFTQAVLTNMRTPGTVLQWQDFRQLYSLIASTDLVISQRLHGLILAALHGIPLLGISDDQKVERFIHEIGQRNVPPAADTPHFSLTAIVLDIWEWRDEYRKNASTLLPTLRTRARRTADFLFDEPASTSPETPSK
jgi:polysaccharide pyruvyl transferase WcaK-like protein